MRSFALPLSALVSGTFATYSDALQNILMNTDKTDKYHYPTDFTREILPKPFHSHNDYWRDVPFYTGLSYGAISTEADVWLINETIYVGHEPSALTTSRTLSSLYIEPLLSTLARLNPSTPFTQEGEQNGVFDTSSAQTLYFFIDLKTGSSETWPAVLAALEPLRRGNWLTTYDGKELFKRPVTVVGTGNTQYHDVLAYLPRDVFFDAPLSSLSSDEFKNITANEAPIASTNFAASFGDVRRREMNDTQLELLREQVGAAHEKGVMARYWNQPAWPVGTRNAIWRTLWDEGVDLLNVDDLKGCSEFWEGGG
ncbi:hypothetical protein HBH50_212490 [Parastagonospora nodorum]|nr:hypothetical protein HBH50_212490 [Parastagonospora nodorum]KAH4088745.1 hypothetical protein HBH48_118480 [Parastagonospora nodorum]KAH5399842.1 hypothetical protein HBI32_179890 [Parastagonospora nodorum]KAH6409086.1 hypothetical protein HBI14_158490 [Parastagonospora nodorum]